MITLHPLLLPVRRKLSVRGIAVLLIAGGAILGSPAIRADQPYLSSSVQEFLANNCLDCHQGDEPKAGLDLSIASEALDVSRPDSIQRWVRIFDRVQDGEMPPADYGVLEHDDKSAFLRAIGTQIREHQRAKQATVGRVLSRRLTRKQVERTLQDLLGIDIPLADYLPEESRQGRYSTIADGQAMSHFQMQAHLSVVDRALDEAFRRAFASEEDSYQRDFDPHELARANPKRRCREPEMRKGKAVIWNGSVIFYGRIPATIAPEDGWYRFALTVNALKWPKYGGVWSTVQTGLCVSSAPLLSHVAAFEATEEPKTIEFETWLPKGHMLEIRPADATLKKGRFAGGQIGTGEGEPQDIPGIAFDRLTMQRFHRGASNEEVRHRLLGGLEVVDGVIQSENPEDELEQQLLTFAQFAFRRPVDAAAITPYTDAAKTRLNDGAPFRDALRFGYRAILCSPRFLYLNETPGPLGPHELAARLSYFLTSSCPDDELREVADSGSILQQSVLNSQVDRLLAGARDGLPSDDLVASDSHRKDSRSHEYGRTFLTDFAAEWLDLEQLYATVPDRKIHPKYDPVVGASMLQETHAFLQHLLRHNESVNRLIDSDFTYLNSRLARYYGVEVDHRDQLRLVSLPAESPRGGMLTHGSILKVTANGFDTSPVVRGVWISERLLGVPIPPAPENVPAIEPDIRGATTIREQLELHRADDACASCHRKIDPSGFALENFDAAGQWREYYRNSKRAGSRANRLIDASYHLIDGRDFQDVRDFRALVAKDSRTLAGNLAENMLVYGTGGPIQFADRDAVEAIVDEAAKNNFGIRSILHGVVTSPIFLNK